MSSSSTSSSATGTDVADNVLALVATGATVLLFTQEHRPAPIVRALRAGAAGIVGSTNRSTSSSTRSSRSRLASRW